MSEDEMKTSNWQEAFQGRDVARGVELVQGLLYEDVGIPVYKINPSEKRTRVLIDRKTGEEDFTVRQKEERDHKLLGLIIPTQEKNEFVYLGIEEGGLVFRIAERSTAQFHRDTASSFSLAWERFGDYLSEIVRGTGESFNVVMREEHNPDKFMDIVVSSVEHERERVQQIKEKRTGVRENLLKKLFGSQ